MGFDTEPAEVLERLDEFVAAVVVPLEHEHEALLSDPRRRYAPSGVLCDEVVALKRSVRTEAARAGLYDLTVPAELGGGGAGAVTQFLVWEHLHATYGPDRLLPYDAVANSTSGPGAALGAMSLTVRRELWPEVLRGERLLCFALSEPARDPGAAPLSTTATRDGGAFLLSGEKQWVSRGGYADYALVYAVVETDGEATGTDTTTAFLVGLDWPGVEIRSVQRLLGRVGGEEVHLCFESVRVPADHVIGEPGAGRALARQGALPGMAYATGRFVGLARWAIDEALCYTATHGSGGRALSESVPVQLALADAAIDTAAARALALETARRGEAGEELASCGAAARLFAAGACARTYERCMDAVGGDALANAARYFDGWQQARIVLAAEQGGHAARQALAGELYTATAQRATRSASPVGSVTATVCEEEGKP